MNDLTYTDYQTYFETIASAHNDVKDFSHYNVSGEPFPLAHLQSFLSKLKNAKTPFLLLEQYAAGYSDNNADTWLKNADGAFLILAKVKNRKDEDIKELLGTTEQIAEEIVGYMLDDFKSTTKVSKAYLDLNDFQIEAIGEVHGYIGVRVDFTINQSVWQKLQYKADKFTFS